MRKHEDIDIEAIRRRAYEISQGPDAGTPDENWLRAEEEFHRPSADEDAVRRDEEDEARYVEESELLQAQISSLTHP